MIPMISALILAGVGLLNRYGNIQYDFLPHLVSGAHSQIFIYYYMSYEAAPIFAMPYARLGGNSSPSRSEMQWAEHHQISDSYDELERAQDYLRYAGGYRKISRIKTFISRKQLATGTSVPDPFKP